MSMSADVAGSIMEHVTPMIVEARDEERVEPSIEAREARKRDEEAREKILENLRELVESHSVVTIQMIN